MFHEFGVSVMINMKLCPIYNFHSYFLHVITGHRMGEVLDKFFIILVTKTLMHYGHISFNNFVLIS